MDFQPGSVVGLVFPEHDLATNLVLILLCVSIVALFFLSVIFAGITIRLRIFNTRKALHWKRLEAEWEPLILSHLVGEKTVAEVHAAGLPRDQLFFIDFLLRYARRLRGEERENLAELARPWLPRIVARMKSGDVTQRARAVHTVCNLGVHEHAAAIIETLDDPAPLVVLIAARALAQKEHPEYAPHILARLERFDSWSQNFIVSMIAQIGPAIAGDLVGILESPSRVGRVRAMAAEALKQLNHLDAADVAVRVLKSETHREVLAACLRLLGAVGRNEHASLVRRFCNSTDPMVRAHAYRTLGFLGDKDDAPVFRHALEDDFPWVGMSAAASLVQIGARDVLERFAASGHPRASLARQALMQEGS